MGFKHVALIMDGNGRWAKAQNKLRTFGHLQGSEKVREIAIAANDLGIEVLTLYAFSTENWKRPKEEVDYLMALPDVFFNKFLKELMAKNIRIQTIGELDAFPESTRNVLLRAIHQTSKNTGMVLCFAMNYGGQREIFLAAQHYHQAILDGIITKDITLSEFEQFLMTKDYPPVDLCIRTSGEMRLSNFLLWQLAYAELVFEPCAWPDLTADHFKEIVLNAQNRDRRFGGL